MKLKLDYIAFRSELLSWFAAHKRDLPWRKTYDPYHVWISEVMLQQTQMDRVVGYFNRWLGKFPDVESVANAAELEILKTWEGLGYYSRARNLQKAARLMIWQNSGKIPCDYDALLALPGVGPYTAAAVMSIAYNMPYPVVDANVERLFARIGNIDKPVKNKNVKQAIKKLATELLADTLFRDFNQALMELGALICTPRNPICEKCPVQKHCGALKSGTVDERPVKAAKQEKIDINMACTILARNNKLFIQKRHYDDVWGGLWEFPGGRMKEGESPQETAVRELFEETGYRAGALEFFFTVTHFYTKYRVTLHSFCGTLNEDHEPKLTAASQYRWVEMGELDDYPFPSGHRQLIGKLKQSGC